MQYPLAEKIGNPDLLVGRENDFRKFNKWIENIPRRLSKSRIILARRKSGKTAFVQRIFNQLWNANGRVIPFYFDISENKVWYPDFGVDYYRTFASHYISFFEREPSLIKDHLTLEEIRAYGLENKIRPLVRDSEQLLKNRVSGGNHHAVWKTAYSAPHRFSDLFDQRVLVILDEFQNITRHVYRDEACAGEPDETMAGSFHYYSESKLAPMLVTGSYMGLLVDIMRKYLEAGRLSEIVFSTYLTPQEGLEAVYKYAEVYQQPITNQAAQQINELCMADPFFISCVVQSEYAEKDLTTTEGVVNTVTYEISDRRSEMSRAWLEYIYDTLRRVNDKYAKEMLLHLSKHNDRDWTPQELKDELHLDMDRYEIQKKLLNLVDADLLEQGAADIDFHGLQDGTLNLVLRKRFEKEIQGFEPDFGQEFHEKLQVLKKDKRRLQGRINYLEGMLAEQLLAIEFRARKRFNLSDYFRGVKDNRPLSLLAVHTNVIYQRVDGKKEEIDIIAQAKDGRVVMVEVRKRKEMTDLNTVEDLWDNVQSYAQVTDTIATANDIIPAFLSLGGFTDDAKQFCATHGIATAEKMSYF